MKKPKAQEPAHEIAEICSHLDAFKPSLHWLDAVSDHTDFHIVTCSNRQSISLLKQVQKMARLAKKAIENNNASGAAFAAMGMMQAAWQAEILESRKMIDAGVTSLRKGEEGRKTRSKKAGERNRLVQEKAKQLRKKNPKWNKKRLADEIAKELNGTTRRGTGKGASYIEKLLR